jgi:hypothetical protein
MGERFLMIVGDSLGPTPRRMLVVGLVGLVSGLATERPGLARLDTWREDSAAAFAKGRREGVVVSDSGHVRLGHALRPLGTLDCARVWDLARGPQGEIYAATGDEGKVFRREANDDAAWAVAYDAPDTQALSVAVGPNGHAYVGTGPSGQVVDVTDAKHPSSRPNARVQYIWDLAFDPKGNLFAATGPTGQLWKRSPDGVWSILYDSKQSHLLCVAVGPDGSVFAGSDGEGLIYKVSTAGKVSVLYDAPQSEVRSLLVASDGTIFAGTAAEAGGGPIRGPSQFSGGSATNFGAAGGSRPTDTLSASAPTQEPPQKPETPKRDEIRPRSALSGGSGSATPRPIAAGDNAVYRIEADGVARELFRARALMFSLAQKDDRVLVGTGPEGQLFELRGHGHESAPLARLDNGQILAIQGGPDGSLLIGTGDPGNVVRLERAYLPCGLLTSDVRDTKLISRFGAISWRADQPPGTSVSVQVRTGNVSEPDATWSDWSVEQTDAANSKANAPAGRFVQYRVKLETHDPDASPELKSISLRYQTANLPPEITRLDVPDLTALDGATRQTRLTFRWDVNDPNDDDLNYTLHLRKEGWPEWVKINDQPLTEKLYSWDATSVPPGLYRVRITASDRPSNNPDDALRRERVSETFIVDHEAPVVSIKTSRRKATAELKDKLTRIAKVTYAIDGGDWRSIFADDGLFDTQNETVTISLSELTPGTHVLVVRATDAAGNIGAGDALVEVR